MSENNKNTNRCIVGFNKKYKVHPQINILNDQNKKHNSQNNELIENTQLLAGKTQEIIDNYGKQQENYISLYTSLTKIKDIATNTEFISVEVFMTSELQ